MSSGFNTNVTLAGRTYHVQTEDRGAAHSKIDTSVYFKGRVLHRHSESYPPLTDAPGNEEAVRARVELQHRRIIEELRKGTLQLEMSTLDEEQGTGITVALTNVGSWISGGRIDLQIEVRRRDEAAEPVPEARVDAHFEGTDDGLVHSATCDSSGHARIQFPVPASGIGGATLVIRASAEAGRDEIRFTLRSKIKKPVAQS